MNNKFVLVFEDKTLSNLTGNKYGRSIFNNQVRETICYDKPVTIVFPDYIDNIGSSFIQGFFDEMVGKIGIPGIEELVDIQSNAINDVKNYIMRKLSL